MASWTDFIEKRAQLIMPPVYKPEVYRQGANNISKVLGGALGGLAGFAGGLWEGAGENDRNSPGFMEGMKNLGRSSVAGAYAGAKTGWKKPELLNNALASSAANFGADFVPGVVGMFNDDAADYLRDKIEGSWFGKMRRDANQKYDEMMEREFKENDSSEDEIARSYEWKDNGETALRWAAGLKALSAAARTVGAGAEAAGVGPKLQRAAAGTVIATPILKESVVEPATRIAALAKEKARRDEATDNIIADNNARGFEGHGWDAGAIDWGKFRSAMGNGLVGGLGLTLPGGLFGKWKNAWKLGLLGLILGAMHGGGAFDGIMQ